MMKRLKKLIFTPAWIPAVLLAVGTPSWTTATPDQTIAKALPEVESLSTLLEALTAAELAEVFDGTGPFTVFAPTNDAFASLPGGALNNLLKPENRSRLVQILTYHVVAGEVTAGQAARLRAAGTLNGQRVPIEFDGRLQVGEATVIQADLRFKNGIVHVIDSVLMPETDNLVGVAENAGSFETLLAAAEAAGLADILAGDQALTIFAPTDAAFASLPEGTVDSLLQPENKQMLIDLLSYHVVDGRVYSDSLAGTSGIDTLAGSSLPLRVTGKGLQVGNATVAKADIAASNGVIHVIDAVLLPQGGAETLSDASTQIIRRAIDRGAPLFNMGQHRACADLYEVAAFAILMMGGDELSPEIRKRLRAGMEAAEKVHSASDRAWAMRYAFDDVLGMSN